MSVLRKCTLLWVARLSVVVLGIGISVLGIIVFRDTGSVLAEYRESRRVAEEIRRIDPKTPEEFSAVVWKAVEIDARLGSPFRLGFAGTIDQLCRYRSDGSGHGTPISAYKPWATAEFRRNAMSRLNERARWGTPYETARPDERSQYASYVWNQNKTAFWTTLGLCLAAGGGVIALGLVFLPAFAVLFTILLLLLLRSGSLKAPALPVSHEYVELQPSGDGIDAPLVLDDGTDAILIQWPAVCVAIVSGIVVVLSSRRLLWAAKSGRTGRAPPIQWRCLMARLLVIILLALCALPAQAGDSIYLQFGEWPSGRGSGLTWIIDTKHVTHMPFVFLDGSVVEYLPLAKLGSALLALGLPVGVVNSKDGIEPYAGLEVRGGITLRSWRPSWRYATRHTRQERFHNMAILGCTKTFPGSSIGIFYEPIRTEDPLVHRLALQWSKTLPRWTLIGEVRTSLDDERRTSMNIDISIPLN